MEQFLALTDMILGKGRVLSTLNAMDVAGHHSQSEVLCTGEHQPPQINLHAIGGPGRYPATKEVDAFLNTARITMLASRIIALLLMPSLMKASCARLTVFVQF